MILVIDNYVSFVYNLVQLIGEIGAQVVVKRNDKVTVDEISEMRPSSIVISPGPGTPQYAGISCHAIEFFAGKIPILGVCLGHQSIAEVFGGRVVPAAQPIHGKVSSIYHDCQTIYKNVEKPFVAARYHSLIVEKESLPGCLVTTAWTEDNLVMGIRHKNLNIEGVQFHPESILTGVGRTILHNFMKGV